MHIKANQFYDPAVCEFEVKGFYLEYLEAESPHKGLGWQVLDVDEAPRPLGSDGQREEVLTQNVQLTRGMKTILVKASPERPKRVITMVQAVCGRTKTKS